MGYDDADIAIVHMMQENGKCSVTDISQTIGYTHQATMCRIKKLQEKGIIERIEAVKIGTWRVAEEKL